jgi:aminoglycoside/choline kinase family phosphotransferase
MSDRTVSPPGETAHLPAEAPAPLTWPDPARATAFAAWLERLRAPQGLDIRSVRLASADASFRRYFRIDSAAGSRIIMDAPPAKEDCAPFAQVAQLMTAAGLKVPEVLAWDQSQGFLLLSDLGDRSLMQVLQAVQPQHALPYFIQAVDALVAWQLASKPGVLPVCGEALLLRELELFPQWYLGQYRGLTVDDTMRRTLDESFRVIMRENLAWPSVYVHCDFMPRNLMLSPPSVAGGAPDPRMGVLDFQDAVYGPVTYDIASLMRDAFLSWEEDFVLEVTIRYWEKARAAGLPVGNDFGAFYRAVEWMGLQRHLRVAGIFARLTLRDGKPRYLADTPRFIGYIRSAAARYRELKPLLRLVDKVEGIQDAGAYVFGRV